VAKLKLREVTIESPNGRLSIGLKIGDQPPDLGQAHAGATEHADHPPCPKGSVKGS
jgi:hypothetical protein